MEKSLNANQLFTRVTAAFAAAMIAIVAMIAVTGETGSADATIDETVIASE